MSLQGPSEELPKFGIDFILPCALHLEELEIDTERDGLPGCPECGKLLDWTHCWFCGTEYLVFGTGHDDVMAAAAVTTDGDLMCYPCAVRYEQEEQEADSESYDWDPQDGP